jgi:hypothetical protein
VFISKPRVLALLALALTLLGGGVARAALSAPSSNGSSEPGGAVNYTPPTGPELTIEQVKKIAVTQAQENGEPSPADITVANGTLEQALHVMDHELEPNGPGGTAEMDSSAKLVVMHGNFTLTAARVPREHVPPKGSVMDVVIDAHTGFVEGRSIGPDAPNLNELGTPIPVG